MPDHEFGEGPLYDDDDAAGNNFGESKPAPKNDGIGGWSLILIFINGMVWGVATVVIGVLLTGTISSVVAAVCLTK